MKERIEMKMEEPRSIEEVKENIEKYGVEHEKILMYVNGKAIGVVEITYHKDEIPEVRFSISDKKYVKRFVKFFEDRIKKAGFDSLDLFGYYDHIDEILKDMGYDKMGFEWWRKLGGIKSNAHKNSRG
jgi:hypothetical protein